jgi:uncharacterized protein with PIN domain
VAKQDVLHRLEPKTRKYFHEFHTCPGCRRIYWAGSHHDRLVERLARLGIGPGAAGDGESPAAPGRRP